MASKQPQIERSGEVGKFSKEDIEKRLRKSTAFWNSAEGRRIEAERRKKAKPVTRATPHPTATTKPAIVSNDPRIRGFQALKSRTL